MPNTYNPVLDLPYVAAEDLSDNQYQLVVLSSSGIRRPNSATEVCIGILQNAPESGAAGAVRIMGTSQLAVNDAIGVNSFIGAEYVSATDAGKGRAVTAGDLAYARGIVVGASTAEDDLADVLLINPIPAIATATDRGLTTVTTDATAGANTWTAGELIGGMLLRDPAGGARSDVSPTAAEIVAGLSGAVDGSSFDFSIRNTADAAETITLTAGTDVTLSGTMTIAQNNTKNFRAVVTESDEGSEAVTIYSLGTFVH